MKILVINAGSSSLKYQLIDMTDESVVAKGLCERITMDSSVLTQKVAGKDKLVIESPMPTHKEAMELVLKALLDEKNGAIKSVKEIGAVGHRVLHSGEDFKCSVVVDDDVIAKCKKNIDLGPLHMPGNISCVEACREVMDVPMVLVFDTTFHATMPPKAFMYGIPYEIYDEYKVRKYGFHGTSHKYIAGEAREWLGGDKKSHHLPPWKRKLAFCGQGRKMYGYDDGLHAPRRRYDGHEKRRYRSRRNRIHGRKTWQKFARNGAISE